ncbi:MAG: anhydro-N-acetylmuramic acid kinase [Vibrio sp.]
MEKYIGIMSGTSLDGIDTALVETDGASIQLLAHDEFKIDPKLRQDVLDVCIGQQTNLVEIGQLDHRLGQTFADAVSQLLSKHQIKPEYITAIGSHGQTVFHDPQGPYPFTMQLGDANLISAQTGITTVADFRRKDMAYGGQGAPLVPAFHQALFAHLDANIMVLNMGGIANISYVSKEKTLGYDTGPANMLMDAWIERHTGQKYDKDGDFAAQGQVNPALLNHLLSDPYFNLQAPKSTGRELFNLDWLDNMLQGFALCAQDVQATLLELTAQSIANEVNQFSKTNQANELLACGGGAQNKALMQRLAVLLPQWQISNTLKYGIDSDYMEAMAFAWLAHQTIHHQSGNLPAVTGASRGAILGAVYFAEA